MKPTIFWISYDQSTFLTIIQLISQRLTDILDIYIDIIDISHIKHVQYVYIYICTNIWLVVSTPLKNMSSAVGIIIPNIWKVIKIHGSKPSTRYIYISTYAIICIHDFSASFLDLRSALSPLIGSTTHTPRPDPVRRHAMATARSWGPGQMYHRWDG